MRIAGLFMCVESTGAFGQPLGADLPAANQCEKPQQKAQEVFTTRASWEGDTPIAKARRLW
jgi:hypothetical protein